MSGPGAKLVSVVRDAGWLTGRVARALALLFGVATLTAAIGWVLKGQGGLDDLGKPLGTDFTSFWAASKLALEGRAAEVYDPATHNAVQQAMFGGAEVPYSAFFYPPVYLLLCLPLALLPYLQALGAWLGVSGLAYWRTAKATWGAGAGITVAILAYPGVLLNVTHGQNAFITAALLGTGALLMTRRPLLAGVCFGALIFKPQLGLLIPIALIASGRWRTILVAGATVAGLCLASLLAFGVDAWRGFLAVSSLARRVLEEGNVGFEKMPSVFAGARLWGAPVATAYAAQALMTAIAAALVILVARKSRDPEALGPALVAASLLATPFLLDYDLVILALPMIWVLSRGRATGFLPWEKLVLAAGFVLPLYARALAESHHLPLGPPVILLVLLLVVRRALGANSANVEPGLAEARARDIGPDARSVPAKEGVDPLG